jgi:UDP-N-acetylglucosamine transferase subunit ALG13
MIFVSVGTGRFPFDRLVRAVDQSAAALHGEPVFVQLGHGVYTPIRCRWARFLSYQELAEQISQARIVVTHGGAGLLLLCRRSGKVPIVVPRRRRFGEHVDDHQVELTRRMARDGHAVLVEEPDALAGAIAEYEERARALRNGGSTPERLRLATSLAHLLMQDDGS